MTSKQGASTDPVKAFADRIPLAVRTWLRRVFRNVNERVTRRVGVRPTGHEQSLDHAFIDALNDLGTPTQLESGWSVRIDTHYLGGLRHFGGWEVADIGVLVHFRQHGRPIGSKSALFQSKRLYPKEQTRDEAEPEDFRIGFGTLYNDSPGSRILRPRTFTLSEDSRYSALEVGDGQYKAIAAFEMQSKIPVYYLLYNPPALPWSATLPTPPGPAKRPRLELGARVISAAAFRSAMQQRNVATTPRYRDVINATPDYSGAHTPGWKLEYFVVDRLLACKDGYVKIGAAADEDLNRLFYRRSGPISAAFAITIDASASD